MSRPLASDELGATGEKLLAKLRLDARLKSNNPDRDRVGWGAIVTWPLDETAPLDVRPELPLCHIQAKTIWAGNDTISINLSTLEKAWIWSIMGNWVDINRQRLIRSLYVPSTHPFREETVSTAPARP